MHVWKRPLAAENMGRLLEFSILSTRHSKNLSIPRLNLSPDPVLARPVPQSHPLQNHVSSVARREEGNVLDPHRSVVLEVDVPVRPELKIGRASCRERVS